MTTRLAALLATTLVVAGVAPAAHAADQEQGPSTGPKHSASQHTAAKKVTVDARQDAYVVREDSRLVVGAGKGLLANDKGSSRADDLVRNHGTGKAVLRPNGAFTFVPKKASHGLEVFAYRTSGDAGTDRASVRIRVLYVNDAPSFVMESLPTGLAATEDTPAPAVDVVKSTSPAPAGQRELVQSVRVKVATADSKMFTKAPAIDKAGMLTYTLAKDASGTAALVLTPRDSGGTRNGGTNLGKPQTLTLQVAPVNDAPVLAQLTASPGVVGEPVTLTAVATDVDAGDSHRYSFDCDADGVLEVGPQDAATTSCTFATVGNHEVTAQVTDKAGATSTKKVTVAVQAQPDVAPSAVNDAATVAEDSAASPIDVLANDTNADGGPQVIASVTQPAHGTVAITGDGAGLTYAPTADYNGADSFTYAVNGGSTATVAVSVTPVDDKPTAVNDTLAVDEDAAATAIDVLANDTDIDNGPQAVDSVTEAEHGTVVLTDDELTYEPDANYNGDDEFTYTLVGGSEATVAVTVDAIDDKPVAVDDAATVAEDSAATTVDVLDNDTDVDNGAKYIDSITQPDDGAVLITGEGSLLTYAPDADFAGTDTFSYTTNGGSQATVTITVIPSDDLSVAVNDAATLDEDADATAIDVLANDTDIDEGPEAIDSISEAAHGTVVIVDEGAGVTYRPDADYNGDDEFTYTLLGGSEATVAVTVNPVDDKPVAVNDEVTLDEDAAATSIDVLSNDTDIDNGPKNVTANTDTAHGTLVVDGNDVTYTPNADFEGTDSFDYTLNGGSEATVTITVNPIDDMPGAVNDEVTIEEDADTTAIDVLANDTDIDNGPLDITANTDTAHGTLVVDGNDVTYTPNADFEGTDSFDYTLNGGSEATVTITVNPIDDMPGAVNDAAIVAEDVVATAVTVLANDTDIDGGPKSIAEVTQPANGTVVITGGGTGLTYKPNTNFFTQLSTPDTFTYTLNGGSTATVSMTVSPVADAGQVPAMNAGTGTTTYKKGTAPVVVAPLLVTTHPDWPSFTGATVVVTISAPGDVLAFTPQSGIVGTYDASTYTLTLSGPASPAAYQAALRSVTFATTGPIGNAPIAFTVTDGTRTATSTKALTITN